MICASELHSGLRLLSGVLGGGVLGGVLGVSFMLHVYVAVRDLSPFLPG